MAVPKRRMSRSNTRSRRSTWNAKNDALVTTTSGGATRRFPKRLAKAVKLGLVDLDKR